VRQGDTFLQNSRHVSQTFVSKPKTSLTVEPHLTMVRKSEVQKRLVSNPLHTEQSLNLKREVTQRHTSNLNLCSEQNITLNRRTDNSTRLSLLTEQGTSVLKRITHKRSSAMNLTSEQGITVVTAGNRRLREQIEALVARVEELEKAQP
jgi:hypothetical protein